MSKKQFSTGPQTNSKIIHHGISERDEIQKLQQDLVIIQAKLNDLNMSDSHSDVAISNVAPNSSIASSFVSGIRGITNMSDKNLDRENLTDTRTILMEKIVDKISELDRCILRKTKPEGINNEIASARRMSRGSDLYLLPTHLHVTDRLLDLSVQLKRERCLTSNLKTVNEQMLNKNDNFNVTILAQSLVPTSPRIATNDAAVTRLSKQLEESQFKLSKLQEDYSAARRLLLDVNSNFDVLKDEMKQKEQVLIEQNNIEIAKYNHHIQLLEDNLAKHQENDNKLILTLNNSINFFFDTIKAKQNVSVLGFNNLGNNTILQEVVGDDVLFTVQNIHQSTHRFVQAVSQLYIDTVISNEILQSSSIKAFSERDALSDKLKCIMDQNNDSASSFNNLRQEYTELKHRFTSLENETELKLLSSNDVIEQLQSELSSSRRRLMELENLAKQITSIQESFRLSETNNIHLELKVKGS